MPQLQRIPVRHGDIFPTGVLFLAVSPAVDFEKRQAKDPDPQARDKENPRLRVWNVECFDPRADRGKREVTVKVGSETQPVPPVDFMYPIEFDGLTMTPWVNDRGRSEMSLRAASCHAPVNGTKPAVQAGK